VSDAAGLAPTPEFAAAEDDFAPDYARTGERLFLQGDVDAALALLGDGLRRAPDGGVAARLVLARMARDAAHEAEEIEWLESALRADPECPAALLRLAELLPSSSTNPYRARLASQEPWRTDAATRSAPFTPAAAPAPATPFASPASSAPAAPSARPARPSPAALFATVPAPTAGSDSSVAAGPTIPSVPEAPIPKPRSTPRPAPFTVPAFTFPVREEEEDAENDENTAPHVATVTLAEIYFQQGLKEQAAQIYRQLLERQPGDAAVKRRLDEIEASLVAPD
jgi:tetratricopeptide (TPR) repeat protein